MERWSRRGLLATTALLLVPVRGNPGMVSAMTVAAAEATATALTASYGQQDLAQTAASARAALETLPTLGVHPLGNTGLRDVLHAQARLGLIRARALADSGDSEGARLALVPARVRAARLHDWPMIRYAYAAEALAWLNTGQPRLALAAAYLGQNSVDLPAVIPLDARLYAARARAWALLAQPDAARDALAGGQRLMDKADPPLVAPPQVDQISQAEWARAAVDVHSRLGDAAAAETVATAMVRAVPPSDRPDVALALGASRALALARTAPDEGAALLAAALTRSAELGTPAAAVTERVDAFLTAATAHGRAPDQAVTDLAERRRSLRI